MKPKAEKNKPLIFVILAAIYAVLLFITVEFSSYKTLYPNYGFGELKDKMTEGMIEYEFKLPVMPENLFYYIGIVTVGYVLAVWYIYARNVIDTHDNGATAYGTAKWLTRIDKYSARFADEEALYAESGIQIPLTYKIRQWKEKLFGKKEGK